MVNKVKDAVSSRLLQLKKFKLPNYAWFVALSVLLALAPLPSFKVVGGDTAQAYVGEDKNVVALSFGPSIGNRIIEFIISPISDWFSNHESVGTGDVKMELFTVSHCPYCKRFIDNTLPTILETYPDMNFEVVFVTSKDADGTYTSMHGASEYEQNLRELCLIEKFGNEKWLDVVRCYHSSNDFSACLEENDVNPTLIENCKDNQGAELIESHYQRSLKAGVTGTPTIIFNDGEEQVVGARPFADFDKVIKTLSGEDVVVEPEVNLIIISPSSCPAEICNPTWVPEMLESQYGANIKITMVDPDNTTMDEESGMMGFPVYIFDKTVLNSSIYSPLGSYLAQNGEFYVLATRPSVMNREETKNTLDVFVMSNCPYGVQGINATAELRAAIPELQTNVWYIANDNGGGTFESLHGQEEVNEDIREVCIMNDEPQNYWAYMTCMVPVYSNSGSEWETCAEQAGVDITNLNECWQGEQGVELLKENVALSSSLGMGSSPTFLVNGRYIISGLPSGGAEGIKGFVCALNTGLEGCEQTLSQGSNVTGSC